MLRVPNSEAGRPTPTEGATDRSTAEGVTLAVSAADVIRTASSAAYGRLADHVVDTGQTPWWTPVAGLVDQPQKLGLLAEDAARERFCTPDRSLALSQVVRESTATLAASAVYAWSCHRRLLCLAASNVAIRNGPTAVITALRAPKMAVLADDPQLRRTGSPNGTGSPDVEVIGEATMFSRLLDQVLGWPQPRNGISSPEPTAALATIIAAARRLEPTGDRHLWGSVALAVASALTKASHLVGTQADEDRATIFQARPDLARLVEHTTVSDPAGETLTFSIRRTCCLLYKLPQSIHCATCSLRDRDEQVSELTDWHLAQRQGGMQGLPP